MRDIDLTIPYIFLLWIPTEAYFNKLDSWKDLSFLIHIRILFFSLQLQISFFQFNINFNFWIHWLIK